MKTEKKVSRKSVFSLSRHSKGKKPSYVKCKAHNLKIVASIILGLIGGASWAYTIHTMNVTFAANSEKFVYYNNEKSEEKPKEEEKIEKEEEKEPTDCYTAAEKFAPKYGVDLELMKRIIKAESGNNRKAENSGSTATGCSQYVIGSWRYYGKMLWGDSFYEKNIYNHGDNVELMAWTIANYGTSPWDASKNVWDK